MNPNQQPLPTAGMFPIQGPTIPGQQQSQQGGNNALLDFLLPTGGAAVGGALGALVPGLGETGVSEVAGASGGQALGKFIENLITGKNPTQDVLSNAEQGALGGLTGIGVGKVLSPILGGIGGKLTGAADQLIGKPTQDIFNSVVQKDPWMLQNTGNLASTASDLGYMDQPMAQSLFQMPKDFSDINSQIKTSISNNNTPMPITNGINGNPSLLDNFQNQLQKSSYGAGNPEFDQSVNNTLQRMTNLSNNGVTDASTIYGEKQNMGNILSNTYDRQARGVALQPKEEVNLAYQQALKDTLDQYGSPEVRALNTKQNQMYDIAKAFGGAYQKQAGKAGAAPFSFRSLFPEEVGGVAANLMGANPLFGMGAAAAANVASRNPGFLQGAGGLASFLGKVAGNPVAQTVGGATGFNALQSVLSPSSVGGVSNLNPENAPNNNQDQTNNTQSSSPSFGGIVTQQGGNVNTNSNTSQNTFNIGGQNIPTITGYDGKTQLPAQLPPISSVQNTIPGQIYSPQQYESDINTISNDVQKNANNPIALQALSEERAAIDQKWALNQNIVNTYISENGLTPDNKAYMQEAAPVYSQMVTLHNLLQSQGGQNLFQAFLQSDPTVQKVLASQNPQYAVMFQMLNQAKLSQLRQAQGGAVRSYDLALSSLGAGQTAKANQAILEQSMGLFLKDYQQYAPLYGLSLQAQQPQQAPMQTQSQTPNAMQQTVPQLYQTLYSGGGQ